MAGRIEFRRLDRQFIQLDPAHLQGVDLLRRGDRKNTHAAEQFQQEFRTAGFHPVRRCRHQFRCHGHIDLEERILRHKKVAVISQLFTQKTVRGIFRVGTDLHAIPQGPAESQVAGIGSGIARAVRRQRLVDTAPGERTFRHIQHGGIIIAFIPQFSRFGCQADLVPPAVPGRCRHRGTDPAAGGQTAAEEKALQLTLFPRQFRFVIHMPVGAAGAAGAVIFSIDRQRTFRRDPGPDGTHHRKKFPVCKAGTVIRHFNGYPFSGRGSTHKTNFTIRQFSHTGSAESKGVDIDFKNIVTHLCAGLCCKSHFHTVLNNMHCFSENTNLK